MSWPWEQGGIACPLNDRSNNPSPEEDNSLQCLLLLTQTDEKGAISKNFVRKEKTANPEFLLLLWAAKYVAHNRNLLIGWYFYEYGKGGFKEKVEKAIELCLQVNRSPPSCQWEWCWTLGIGVKMRKTVQESGWRQGHFSKSVRMSHCEGEPKEF